MKLLIVLIFIWIYCILSNLYWYIKAKAIYSRFKSGKEMSSYIPEVDELFKTAKTSYQSLYDENKGSFNQRSFKDVSYLCDKKKYQNEVDKVFLITIGTFRSRLKHSVLPIRLLFLPSYLFDMKGINAPLILKLFMNGIYWIIGCFASYHLDALLDYVYLEYLKSIFAKIL